MDKNKRSLKNYLINPSFQLRITIYFLVAAFSSTSLVMFLFYRKFMDVRIMLLTTADIPITLQMAVDNIMYDFILLSLVAFILMAIGVILVGVLVTHRIAGPMFAILAFIEDLKKGNYDSPRKLRPYDELSPIMDSLKDLAAKLKK